MGNISIGLVGAGQFGTQFAPLFAAHPGVDQVIICDGVKERADALVRRNNLQGAVYSYEDLLKSDVSAVAIFTQRWLHGPMAIEALKHGKHVYSTVPMAIAQGEIEEILQLVTQTGLIYMMGETSHYNPAAVYGRQKLAASEFGRLFYAEGDYVHDMDLGFYDAYKYSGGDRWKETASYPPMLYPTHALGGVLAVWPTHITSVSCLGMQDSRGDGVFDKDISAFGNDISNATALFETADGGAIRTNEFRRVGFPSPIRESRFSYFGTEGSFEESTTGALWQTKDGVADISNLISTKEATSTSPELEELSPALRGSFLSGYAPVHDSSRIPEALRALPNGHEGSHHFLVDDFVTAASTGVQPPVNAWQAARYTLPGIVAHQSALRDGERLPVPDMGPCPTFNE